MRGGGGEENRASPILVNLDRSSAASSDLLSGRENGLGEALRGLCLSLWGSRELPHANQDS